ncbi:MAG: hypothetical protein HYZ28_18110 [Myxococcales bacterium]|nr:hypothetical protein [Myxococcales bacterium]
MPDIRNPIQRFFWDNLTRGGLDLVDANRVDELVKYAKENRITEAEASPVPAGQPREVDTFETSALKHLLESDWRNLLTDDGVRRLEQVLDIRTVHAGGGQGREAIGEVPHGTIEGNLSRHIGRTPNIKLEHTAAVFNHEYNQRKAELFENPRLSEDERAKKLLHLLEDYAKVINAAGSGPEVVQARQALLEAFFEKPAAKTYGAADPDDDLLGTAWEIAWGTDPERPEGSFEIDRNKSWSAYMSMNGEFVGTAKKVDEYLAALGKPANAEAFEKKSPLNWIVGEETGNTKPSSTFAEASAIRSTGVDFAKKLLSDERAVGKRTLDPSVDLKVDFYAWGNFVSLNKARGEKLVPIHDETKKALKVELENVGENHWKPVFKDEAGAVVDPSKVTCVIQDARGNVKGDGQAQGSYSASWWGFCDRNAMQGLVTMKYGFPQPQKDATLKVGEKEFKFTAADVRLIVGRRLTELFPETTQAGNRYDDEPDQIHLKDGTVLAGKIGGELNFYKPDTYRTGDTMVLTPDSPEVPKGNVLVSVLGADGARSDRDIKAEDIQEIRRAANARPDAVTGQQPDDKIVLKDGTELTGALKTKLSFREAERQSDGTLVLKNSAERPILGEVAMTTVRGEAKRVPLSEVSYLVREDLNEVLAEEALAYIVRNKGIFAADSWTGSSVANGTRTIEEIKRWPANAADKPSWAPADPSTLTGYRGKVKDPDNLYYFNLGNKGSTYGGLQFWMELDENRKPINSGVISGQWDFLWGVEGKPDWNAKGTFNPHVPNDVVLKLYVNSLENPEAVAHLLPDNWRELINR